MKAEQTEKQRQDSVKQLQDLLLTQVLRMHIGLSDEYANVARSVVCVSVCLYVGHKREIAKMAEPIKKLYWM